ncbi:BTAD domain-containing putative transcriptional regulator [Spongiactinospora sp. TRM90649]|uniref:AfsR/SARP family transcriptional regulator n=1 Tax=Spongiactinospora sp. TRM90649 TaxID=3031114 RepID=UPI0023F6A34D|nr:BTAD domain-containing putative transcriptional regulator [Spongiactinospora sp. TRM90649]MDF5757183.1 BTAD domain-containing putative transcriptional regulator [Spongiactinospora sp. TRM90649]
MEFRVLGPLEVAVGDRRLDLGGIRQRTVLALLLLDPNRIVTIGRLMVAIYGDNPPTTSRSQVQICISALRRMFAKHGVNDLISTHSQGYAIQAGAEQIDAHRFESLLQRARQSRETGDAEDAARQYREALSLWRGPVLDGIESRLVQSAAGRLTENRIAAQQDCIELELELGRHQDLVGELTELVEEHPLRERLRGQLMLALYRSGRQAEALQVYRTARRTMIDELGLEPNEHLQRLEYAILTSDERLAVPVKQAPAPDPAPAPQPVEEEPRPPQPGGNVPHMLPTDIADFTGRTKQVEEIRQQLVLAAEDRSRFAVPVIVIAGKAGIGKSTIAVHTSHSVSDRFPDGQLYADLHGAASRPISPMQVLERFLRALRVSGSAIPDTLDERAEMYRDLLADRRMLVVLDDAGNEGQVVPLLPGNPACAVIVTSRSRLAGLAGAIHVDVDVFDVNQSIDLLSRIAGAERVQSEADAAANLAELCGQLPLALRIAGARLSARPHWSIEQLAGRLEDETRRLDELKHGEMGIRASISLTYESTSEQARRLFRRLAILDAQLFSAWVSAALLDEPLDDTQDLLDDLADAQLIETTGVGHGIHSQYRFHDLIRVFARERLAAEESSAERSAALGRVLGALLFLAEAAHRKEYGGDFAQVYSDAVRWPLPGKLVDQLVSNPLVWYERERLTLVSGIRQAAQAGLSALSWDLAITSVTLFESRVYFDDWRDTHEIALAAAHQARDKRGQAAMLYSLGHLHIAEQRFDEARSHFDAALQLFREVCDDQGIALVIRNIGLLDRMDGRFAEAAAYYEQALDIFRSRGDLIAAAHVLHNIAQLRLEEDDFDGAKELLAEALRLCQESGGRRVAAQVLHRMGLTYLQSEDFDLAVGSFEEALGVVREMGDRAGEAYVLHGLGLARMQRGEYGEAEGALRQALMLAAAASHRLVEGQVQIALGELALADDRATQGIPHIREAVALFGAMKATLHEARAYSLLADAHRASGDGEAATQALTSAVTLTEDIDSPIGERMRTELIKRLKI